jgi:tetratricopeptide (TPR) repeat protein
MARTPKSASAGRDDSVYGFRRFKFAAMIPMGIPVAVSLLAGVNTLWNGFAVDDQQQVLNSTFIRSLSNLPLAFTSSVWSFGSSDIVFTADSYFRPLFNVLFTINYAVFGTHAWGWHLVNILIHAGAALLTFVLLKEITGRDWLALVAACLFAAHPVHAESVAWISGVPDPLMALFLIPAFYFYLRYRQHDKNTLLAGSLGFFLLALLTKETALAFPLLILFTEWFYFEDAKTFGSRIVKGLTRASLFALPAAIYSAMRYQAISNLLLGGAPRYPLGPALKTAPLALTKYLALMVAPTIYSYQHYTLPVQSVASIRFIGPLALLIAIAAVVAVSKSRLLWLAAIWFVVFLAPALAGLRQFDPEYAVQERYLYVPSIGFCLALALGVEWIATRELFRARERNALIAITAVLVVVLGAFCVVQNRVWNSTTTVLRNCVALAPGSSVAHSYLAQVLADRDHMPEAVSEAQRAVDLDPKSPTAYLKLSYVDFRRHKLDEASTDLEKGLATIRPDGMTRAGVATMQLNLALLYAQRKDMARADDMFRQTIATLPRPVGWYNAGEFYLEQGRYEEARTMFEAARDQLPGNYAPIHLRLGRVYELLGDAPQARASYHMFLRLAPPDAPDRSQVMQHLQAL